jgi:hypothetical protein
MKTLTVPRRVFHKTDGKGQMEYWSVRIARNMVIREGVGPNCREKSEGWYSDLKNAMTAYIREKKEQGWKEINAKAGAPFFPPLPRIPVNKSIPLKLPVAKVNGKTYPRVDRAVGKVRAFVNQWPQCQVLVEDVAPGTNLMKRCEDVEGDTRDFIRIHKSRFGRWHRKPDRTQVNTILKADGSPSYRYFCARYGSLTWASSLDGKAVGFLIGNVTGGGYGIVEICDWFAGPSIGELIPDDKLETDYQGHGLDSAVIFHGGWGMRGWAFDTRRTSKSGDWPIVPFTIDSPKSGLLHDSKLVKINRPIEPFDAWLEREVDRCIRALLPDARREAAAQRADL